MDTSHPPRPPGSADSAPSHRVVHAVADREETEPESLDPPLFSVVDPEALDSLCESAESTLTVSFTYLGYEIVVDGDGEVAIAD